MEEAEFAGGAIVISFCAGAFLTVAAILCTDIPFKSTKDRVTKMENICKEVGSTPKVYDEFTLVCENGFEYNGWDD